MGQHHNMYYSPEYKTWAAIKYRCSTLRDKHKFKSYAGKNIKMCDKWKRSFMHFYNDMGPKPTPKHSIDRINNNKGYSKNNCRWATKDIQANNTSANKIEILNGIKKTRAQWSKELGGGPSLVHRRLSSGWTLEDALTTKKIDNLIEYKGEKRTLTDWAKIYNLTASIICRRLKRNWSLKKSFETPRIDYKKIKIKNRQYSFADLSRKLKAKSNIVLDRVNKGWSLEKAISTPIKKYKYLSIGKDKKSISDWSKLYNVPDTLIHNRIKLGWPIKDAITKPVKKRKNDKS